MLSEDKNAEAKEKDGASAGKAANKNGKRKEKKNGGRGFLGRISLKWRLFAVFSGFALLILLLLWLFQTCFLDTIYRRIKIAQMNSAVSQLAACSAEELESTLNQAAENGGLCIHVFDKEGWLLGAAGTRPYCLMRKLGWRELEMLAMRAQENGGTYFSQFEQGPGPAEPDGYLMLNKTPERLIAIDATLTPLDATVSTVRVTLIITTVITVLGAAVIAGLLSRRVASPIEGITACSRRLPEGKFGFEAPAGAYPEIKELAGTLQSAAVEISRTDDLKRELFANVSHDLRTPLTMISGYAEVMRDIPGENSAENVQIIIDEAQRLTRLVNDMLDLSKLQSITTFEPVKCSLTALISDILRRYNKLRETQGYVVEFAPSCEVYVMGDELRLSQVIYNLVNNAIDFTGPDKKVVVRQILKTDGRVRIEVKDSGEGIPQDKLPYIWDRYYKVDKEHKRSRVGTGLGLSIVKEALEKHGADYGVISGSGGSTFWFEMKALPSGTGAAENGLSD